MCKYCDNPDLEEDLYKEDVNRYFIGLLGMVGGMCPTHKSYASTELLDTFKQARNGTVDAYFDKLQKDNL